MSLLRLVGAFVQATRMLFLNTEMLRNPMARSYVWKPKPGDVALTAPDSQIFIEPNFRFNKENASSRPFIAVQRGPLQTNIRLMGGGTVQSPGEADWMVGRETHHRERHVPIRMNVISQEGGTVELLLDELLQYFDGYAPHWARELSLSRIVVQAVSEVQPKKEYAQLYAGSVDVMCGYQDVWALRPQSPVLGGISLSFR